MARGLREDACRAHVPRVAERVLKEADPFLGSAIVIRVAGYPQFFACIYKDLRERMLLDWLAHADRTMASPNFVVANFGRFETFEIRQDIVE